MAIKHLVSLGGSFAAGVGMPPWLNSSTMRSSQNYAHLVAQRTGARLTDMSAAGADTSNMMDTWQPSNSLNVLARERLPPQLTGVTEDTDLVTITAGRFLCRRNEVTTASSILFVCDSRWGRPRILQISGTSENSRRDEATLWAFLWTYTLGRRRYIGSCY